MQCERTLQRLVSQENFPPMANVGAAEGQAKFGGGRDLLIYELKTRTISGLSSINIDICLDNTVCVNFNAQNGYAAVPALLVFVSVVVVRTVLCGTAGLHFPPHFLQPRSTAYGPIHSTAELTPSDQKEEKGIIEYTFSSICSFLIFFIFIVFMVCYQDLFPHL